LVSGEQPDGVDGAAAGAVVWGGGATALDVADTAVLRGLGFGFGFGFVATAAGVGEDVAVKGAEATVDARAEALAIGEVLPADVEFPPQSEIPIMSSTMKAITVSPALCSFFIGSPSDGPPLSV
jgi:hypothetical protein